MARPVKPYRCRECGERAPHRFNAEYKSLCAECRRYQQRIRYWHARGRYL